MTKERDWKPLLKFYALSILLIFITLTSSYLVVDAYENGSPFCLASCPTKIVTVEYPFSISLSSRSQVFGNADLRVGIFLTFDTTAVAGENIGIRVHMIISPTADPRIRNGSVAIVIIIPNAQIAPPLNNSAYGIPNDFTLDLRRAGNSSDGSIYYEFGPNPIGILFPDQGDYHVYVGVQSYHYDSGPIEANNIAIHVEPRSMEQSLLLGRESRTFTFALLVFAIMDAAFLLPQTYRGSLMDESRKKPSKDPKTHDSHSQ